MKYLLLLVLFISTNASAQRVSPEYIRDTKRYENYIINWRIGCVQSGSILVNKETICVGKSVVKLITWHEWQERYNNHN